MKFGIANDHSGVILKNRIIHYLKQKQIDVINYGTDDIKSVDYVDYAVKLCEKVIKKEVDYGILICKTGNGMCIAANKVKGIRCAKINNKEEARLAKNHNMANVVSFPASIKNIKAILNTFINTENSKEERHIRRVNKLMNIK